MQVKGAREREQFSFREVKPFSVQQDFHLEPVRRIGKFCEHHWHIIKDTMQKGGAHLAWISFFERTARRKITIPDCKNRFLMVLFFRVECFFNDFPHDIYRIEEYS